jgi:hypothetical protein
MSIAGAPKTMIRSKKMYRQRHVTGKLTLVLALAALSLAGALVLIVATGGAQSTAYAEVSSGYFYDFSASDALLKPSDGPYTIYLPLALRNYPPSNRYAVIYGVADYPGSANDLNYTDDDAEDFRTALITDGGFQTSNVRLRLDSEATSTNMQNDITSWLASTVGPNDLVVFYFSGHGSQGLGSEWLCTYDPYWVSDTELDSWLDTLASQRVVVMIDACHCGGFITSMATGALLEDARHKCLPPRDGVARDIAADAFIKDVNQPGRVVIAASRADEYSYETSYYEHGIFTYHLLQGLGSISADTHDGNGWISAEEAFDYLYPRVVADTGDDQHPQESDGVPGEVDLTQP